MVTMIRSDLEFIFAQILIAEADARGEQLLGTYIPNSELPWGLRRVDGSDNNLITGQGDFGAADQPFPRSTTETFINEGDDGMPFGPPILVDGVPLSLPGINGPGTGVPLGYIPGPGGNWLNNNDYGVQAQNTDPNPRAIQPGDVVDADPRTISNLIVDQTANNPAAIFKALQEAGLDNPTAFVEMGNVALSVDAVKAAEAAGAPAIDALAAAEAALADAQEALDLANAANAAQALIIAAYQAADAATDAVVISTAAVDVTTSALVAELADSGTVPAVVDAEDIVALNDAVAAVDTLLTDAQAVVSALLSAPGVSVADITAAQDYVTSIVNLIPTLAAINLGDSSINALDALNAAIAELTGNGFPTVAADLDAQIDVSLADAIAFDTGIAAATQAVIDAQAAVDAAAPAAAAAQIAIDTAGEALRTQLEGFGISLEESPTGDILKATLFIGNVAPDEGLSAPFNGFMTLFGQFFDHGLDLVSKGGWGSVYVPLQPDDPQYVEGSNTNFMVLTRATLDPVTGEPINLTTPFVDQNQTYTSTPSAQVFHREYEMRFDAALGHDVPKATGRLLNGVDGGLATWADVKAQALNLLGIELDDFDIHAIPLLATDPYGNFIPGPNGFPQIVTAGGLVEGDPLAPADASTALKTGHAFLDDIAHNANPGFFDANPDPFITTLVPETEDADTVAGTAADRQPAGTYDDELLDAHFITGDGRGNENIGLTAVHHVFHSEHNRQVGLIKDTLLADAQQLLAAATTAEAEAEAVAFLNNWLDEPVTPIGLLSIASVDDLVWNGERMFQAAKFPTEMQYQHLVFEEFARKVQPLVNVFNDYDATLNPAILAEFAHTVYRFGHSMLTETVDRLDASWNPIGSGGVAAADAKQIGLIEAFLNPVEFVASGVDAEEAAGNIIRGMTRQHGNEIDEFVTEALRNNLVGLPLDLATLNIARGRETGVPTLNEARAEFFAGSGDPAVKPYESWFEFAQNLKNPASVINFIAAYGTHATILAATNLEEKRDAATALVLGGAGAPADRFEFLNHTGAYAADANRGGLNDIDFWIGGLAEKKFIFGGFLGSTFNFVFETQLEALQNGDRFYYLSRLANLNLTAQLENNKFSEMIHRNTTATHLPGDAFALPNYFLEADITKQFNHGLGVGVDPTTVDVPIDPFLSGMQGGGTAGLVLRSNVVGTTAGRLEYTGAEHVVLGGTDGNDHLIGGLGDDTLWGDAGDDRLEGGDGNDFIFGGLGNDIITDIFGVNEIRSNEGDDVVSVGTDLNLIITDTGRDAVFGGNGLDEILLGQGDDFADGGAGEDFIIGGEGNDWLETGTENSLLLGDNGDLVQGLPIKRSVDSRIEGHDVLYSTGGNADFDAETGDDIMVGGQGTDRFFGQFGFDWATYKNDPFGLEADMNLRLFAPPSLPGSSAAILDRYAQVEALSGSSHTDILRGDDIADLAGGAGDAGAIVPGLDHALRDANVALINGLDAFLGTIDEAGENRFTAGNILFGGEASDLIEGRGGNDLIDGDRWLNVRIARRDENGNEIESHDTLAGYKSRLISGEIKVAELHIVREILDSDDSIDIAQFSGPRAEYSIEGFDGLTANDTDGDGFITVSHDAGGIGLGVDGVDRLKNVERLMFSDGTIKITTHTNTIATGTPTITGTFEVGEVLTASTLGIVDPDGIGPVTFYWQVETVAGTGVFDNIQSIVADEFSPVTGTSFTLTAAEAGLNVRVLARFLDNEGVIEHVSSAATTVANPGGVIPGAPVAGDPAAILGFDLQNVDIDGVLQPLGTVGILEDEPGGFAFTAFDLIAGGTGALSANLTTTGPNGEPIFPLGITDPDGDAILITNVALREIGTDALGNLIFPGTLDADGLGGFIFTPNPDFNGGVTLTFEASDGINLPVPMEATLEVLPVNDAPTSITATAADAIAALPAVGNIVAQLVTVDVDVNDRGAFTLDAGSSASFAVTPNGALSVVAALGNNQTHILNLTGTDEFGASVSETMRVLTGGAGGATTNGNAGDDIIFGLGGADTLNGNAGNDLLFGGNGGDTLNGNDGDDTFNWSVGNGRDIINGGLELTVGDTAVFNGNAAEEVFRVFARADALAAGLTGLNAATEIVVTRNANGINAAVGNGNIIGELAEIEEIVINTGAGIDTVLAVGNFDPTNLAFNTIRVNDEGEEDTIVDQISSNHNLAYNPNSGENTTDDTYRFNDSENDSEGVVGGRPTIVGSGDQDYLVGDDSDERFLGLDGDDEIYGGDGNDHIFGGLGDDELDGGDAADWISGESGDDRIEGGHGGDRLWGGDGNDEIEGGADGDLINGMNGNDVLYGDDGNDTLWGFEGRDRLEGGKGDDHLLGGAENDVIIGGRGNDHLKGEAGVDQFQFGDDWGKDNIYDFEDGLEKIDFSSNTEINGFADLVIGTRHGFAQISFGDDSILLVGVDRSMISADDFIF